MELNLKISEKMAKDLLEKFNGDEEAVREYAQKFLTEFEAHLYNYDHYHDDDPDEED